MKTSFAPLPHWRQWLSSLLLPSRPPPACPPRPAFSGVVENVKAWWASRPAPEPVAPDTAKADAARLADMRLVLDLAARLKADGVADGVALCQQLLDVMLTGTKAKK